MAILANRVKTKNHLLELAKFAIFSLKKFLIVAIIFGCSYLLYSPNQNFSKWSLELSGTVVSVGAFISDIIIDNGIWIYDRLSYFKNIEAENIKLKMQVAELSKVQLRASNLSSENHELRKLLNVTDDLKYNHITSRLVGVNITPLASVGIIQAGSRDNVKINDLITNQDGLVGKVVNVSQNYSSVMLVSDPNSRVPVITSTSRERGILAKKEDNMQLIYLAEDHNIEIGELIYTSGDGKIYPYGLLIGHVAKITEDGIFVKLSVNLNNTDFVRVESKEE
jgi:rod shape-determining protein MreC